jgi:hypothetical protein
MKYEGHTPGPWKFGGHPDADNMFIGGENEVIVMVPNCNFMTSEDKTEYNKRKHANAKLIADAPMLVEQNEKMLAHIKGECVVCAFYRDNDDIEVNINKYCTSDWCSTKDLIAEVEATK